MANRRLYNFSYSYERDIVNMFANVTIGVSGAPTLTDASKGIKSVVRNSAGDYTINFTDSFNKLLSADLITQNASGIPTVATIGIKANNVSSASAPGIEFVLTAATSSSVTTSVATDPANGDRLFFNFILRNAST